jgi:hypothetical protein
VGVKETLNAHVWPMAIAFVQVSVSLKSPEMAILEIARGALPALAREIGRGALEVPTSSTGNWSIEAEKLVTGALRQTEA